MKKKNKGHDNLIPPKKGEIRNPNGRPKGSQNSKTILNKFLESGIVQVNPFTKVEENMTVKELLNLVIIKKGLEGDLNSYKEILDRTEGKLSEQKDINITSDKAIIEFKNKK